MTANNREIQIIFRCNQELRDAAKIMAIKKGQSLCEWMRRAIMTEIERQTVECQSSCTSYREEFKPIIDGLLKLDDFRNRLDNLVKEIELLKNEMESDRES